MEKIKNINKKVSSEFIKLNWTTFTICVLSMLLIGSVSNLLLPADIYNGLMLPAFTIDRFTLNLLKNFALIISGVNLFVLISTVINPSEKKKKITSLAMFFIHLFLISIYPLFFYALNMKFVSTLILLLALTVSIVMTAFFFKLNRVSAYLNIPVIIYTALIILLYVWMGFIN